MTEGGSAPARWGTAAALTAALVLLSALHALPLLALPLGILLVALPGERRWRLAGAAMLAWAVALGVSGGALSAASRGWALMLGSAFLFASVWRPAWGVLPRALLAVALSLVVGAAALAATGSMGAADGLVREHFAEMAALARQGLQQGAAGTSPALGEEFVAATERMGELQWTLFPALLALQSLAALALAAWWAGRLGRDGGGGRFRLRPIRDFRFNDQLVWLLIAGLLLVLIPAGALATRLGYNALLFMGALYALRGVGVFVFLASGAQSVIAIAFAVLAAIFLYPLVLTAAVLVGLGDTWLDVRGRAALAPRA